MSLLIDTNVLLRSVQPSHPMHLSAVRALETLIKRQEDLVITFQNVAEFWNVATRPVVNNGLGFTMEEVRAELTKLETFFEVLCESSASYETWKELLIDNRVSGVQVHDARLVAVMKTRGIAKVLTFNVVDFTLFPGIEAIHPDEIA